MGGGVVTGLVAGLSAEPGETLSESTSLPKTCKAGDGGDSSAPPGGHSQPRVCTPASGPWCLLSLLHPSLYLSQLLLGGGGKPLGQILLRGVTTFTAPLLPRRSWLLLHLFPQREGKCPEGRCSLFCYLTRNPGRSLSPAQARGRHGGWVSSRRCQVVRRLAHLCHVRWHTHTLPQRGVAGRHPQAGSCPDPRPLGPPKSRSGSLCPFQ